MYEYTIIMHVACGMGGTRINEGYIMNTKPVSNNKSGGKAMT